MAAWQCTSRPCRQKEYWQDAVCCLQTFMQDLVFCLGQVVHLHLPVHDAMFHSIYMQGAGSAAERFQRFI